jgi:hypothetical protein
MILSACFLTDAEIEIAPEIDRIGCPVCDQRGHDEPDCICCGGVFWVDVDDVREIVYEHLNDRDRDGKPAAAFVLPGVYCLEGEVGLADTFVVRDDQTVIRCTEQADALWEKRRAKTRWGFWAFVRAVARLRKEKATAC